MAVNIWVGRTPQGYEAQVLRQVAANATEAGVDCHLFANFLVNGREIDLLLLKRDGIFLVELKQVGGVVRGAINGDWSVGDGRTRQILAGGSHANPYQQMLSQYRVLSEWLETHKQSFLDPYAASVTHFRPDKRRRHAPVKIRSLLAFYPQLPAGSAVSLDWKVEAVGTPEMVQIVVQESTPRVSLTERELVALARQLNLKLWALQAAAPAHRVPTRSTRERWLDAQLAIVERLISRLDSYRQQLHAQRGSECFTTASQASLSLTSARLEVVGR